MIQYILECIAFQLAFLVIYDFFLKRETFFQWNRFYLIATYIVSLVLPWIKIEALKTTVPEQYFPYSEFLWNGNSPAVIATGTASANFQISWQEGVLYGGMLLAAFYFGYKLYRLQQLRAQGTIARFPNFTRVVVNNSELAFSFFKSIFLGDKVLSREHKSIIQHELVHIKQRHSLDLVFFELMRIIGWFNPLVYVYQNRVSELHEFIADAHLPKTERTAHYNLLLSQVFQTQNISFVNQFYKKSLIKKRIVMLQKSKSKRIFKLKYLILMPLILGMLFYSSCSEEGVPKSEKSIPQMSLKERVNLLEKEIKEKDTLTGEEKGAIAKMIYNIYPQDIKGISGVEGNIEYEGVPFSVIDEIPIFPGCEDVEDKRVCFNKMMQKHISKNFRYPIEAQEKGIQGRVNIIFTIGKDGVVQNLRMRGPDALLENEAKRIVDLLPNMKPGKQKGKEVDVPYSIPVTFKL
jgi:bla regulator protein BlaR1